MLLFPKLPLPAVERLMFRVRSPELQPRPVVAVVVILVSPGGMRGWVGAVEGEVHIPMTFGSVALVVRE